MHRDSSVVEGASVLNSIDPVQDFQENWISQNELGEGSGLRGDDNSRSSGGGHLHIAQSDPAGGRQHDLHERHGQGGTATEETTLSSRFLSALRTFVDWGSPFHYSDSPPDFSNSSNIEELMRFSAANESTQLASSPSTDGGAMHSNVPSTSSHVHVETSHTPTRNRSRASPFCPCFSPTVSDSEEDDLDGSPAAAMSDQLRQRLAIAGSAANQLPMTVRRRSSIATSLDVPVHRIVEYSHHLVPDVDKIYAASYYWGVMDRFKAEQLLEGKPEGTFLLRDSAQTEYLFSVSFRRYQRTLHARIEQGNHRFGFDILDDTVFSSATVTGLIENYKDPSRCLFFEPQLTHPLHRNYVFSLQELCRAKIVSNTSYSLVSRLQLPPKMRNYIRDYHYTVPVRTVIKQHD